MFRNLAHKVETTLRDDFAVLIFLKDKHGAVMFWECAILRDKISINVRSLRIYKAR